MDLSQPLIFIFSLISIKIIQKYASFLGLLDTPNRRSIHTQKTPRGGGIGFFLSVFLILPFFYGDVLFLYLWTYLALFLIFVMGWMDDYRGITPTTKFIIIWISTMLLWLDGIRIDEVGVYFGTLVTLGWFSFPFTLFAVSGFTNALNLIDGLDGLSSVLSLLILGTFYSIGVRYEDSFIQLLSLSFILSLIAFLLYNWHPASIFMGDSGSLSLGFVISIVAVKSLEYIPAVHILFFSAIPVLDTLIVMIRRKRRGGSAFRADKSHIHHIMMVCFDHNTPKTVLFLALIQLIYILIGVNLSPDTDGVWLLFLFVLHGVGLYHLLNYLLKRGEKQIPPTLS